MNASERGKCAVYTSRTATGTIATHGTIATDPRVFPFGTRFVIPHYGAGVARDTGGYIKGHHIDLAYESCSAAISFGAREIYIAYRE